jgi:hypothetical protein
MAWNFGLQRRTLACMVAAVDKECKSSWRRASFFCTEYKKPHHDDDVMLNFFHHSSYAATWFMKWLSFLI